MKITSIAQQEKRQGRYSIFVDGKYAFSFSETALLEHGLHSGQELSPSELTAYKRLSADDKIYNQALRYAAMRRRSTWEVEQYLWRKQASPLLSSQVLNKLTNIGLLDDMAFAQAWVENRRLLHPTSKRKLQQELRAKHVADEVVETVLANDSQSNDQVALLEMVAKKRGLPKYKADPLKLMQYLARQGFSYDDIKSALHGANDEM